MRTSQADTFLQIWYVADEHATGLQHFHLARILLASHNPSIPKLGPGRAAALRKMDDEIRDHVRTLCGMCLSNPSNAPAFTYASMGATLAGDKFTKYEEQVVSDTMHSARRHTLASLDRNLIC